MENRRLGKTEHMSSVLTFGGAAIGQSSQYEVDSAIELAMQHGINHFDVAPSYGNSETLLGPWMKGHHDEVFLGCKTLERTKTGAYESLNRSLDRLQVDYFDLFQFHGVNDIEALDTICGEKGALEAVLEAREQNLIKYIGITGHRPSVQVEALNRFPFDTVLFPLNRVLAVLDTVYSNFTKLLEQAKKKDVGMIAIKAISKKPWQQANRKYRTWYEPFDTQEEIDKSIWYALSQGVTTLPMASDVTLWPMIISAAECYQGMDEVEQELVKSEVKQYDSIFPDA